MSNPQPSVWRAEPATAFQVVPKTCLATQEGRCAYALVRTRTSFVEITEEGPVVARYRFSWENLPIGVLRDAAEALHLEANAEVTRTRRRR